MLALLVYLTGWISFRHPLTPQYPRKRTHCSRQTAPTVWNTLPYEIRSPNTISSFKSSLKTYLFQQSYWLCVCGGGAEREREWGGERERELVVHRKVRVFCLFVCRLCNGPCAPKEKWHRKEHIIMKTHRGNTTAVCASPTFLWPWN